MDACIMHVCMYVCMYACMYVWGWAWLLFTALVIQNLVNMPSRGTPFSNKKFSQGPSMGRYIPLAVSKDCSSMALVIDIIWWDTWYEYHLVWKKISKTYNWSGYQLPHSGLSLDINHGYRESAVHVVQAYITIIQCCTYVLNFPSVIFLPSPVAREKWQHV